MSRMIPARRLRSPRRPPRPPRPSFTPAPICGLPPEGLAQQVAESDRDQQRPPRILAHLALDPLTQTIDVRLTQPIRARLETARHALAEVPDPPPVGRDRRVAVTRRPRQLLTAATAAQALCARLKGIGEAVLRLPRTVAHPRADVRQALPPATGDVLR